MIRFNFTIPQAAFEGEYVIYGRLAAVQILNISEVTSAKINVTKPPEPLANDIKWDSIYLLFLVYTVPGAPIERLIEALRYKIIPKAEEGDALAKSNRTVIDKLKGFTLVLDKKTLDKTRDWLKEYEKRANHEESKVKLLTWVGAFLIALIPSYFLMAYNLSLLAIMGYSDVGAQRVGCNNWCYDNSICDQADSRGIYCIRKDTWVEETAITACSMTFTE
jgi:hypothetical protein